MVIPRTMKAAVLIGHGGVDRLEIQEVPVPRVGDTDVLIRIAAAGVNNTDINTRIGWYSKTGGSAEDAGWGGDAIAFPRIQGADVCGHIAAVGSGVDPARIGERVIVEPVIRERGAVPLTKPQYLGSDCDGGFAEFVVVPAANAVAIRSELSDVELASFPCSYSTAENLLTRAGVVAGDVVLVTGASGGVGSAVIQLALARRAVVFAVTSAGKMERVAQLGVQRVIDRNDNLIAALGFNSVDVAIDLVAGERFPDLLELVKPFGRYAASGAVGGPLVELDVRTLYLKDLTLIGCTIIGSEVFGQLVERIENAEIKPLVWRSYLLEDIATAQESFGTHEHVGKIVLTVQR